MDYKNYLEKKASGNAEIIKAGGGHAIAVKRYSEETGELTAPEITAIDLEGLEKEKLELQDKITDIDNVITEVKATPIVKEIIK